jgi:hypothetical protein
MRRKLGAAVLVLGLMMGGGSWWRSVWSWVESLVEDDGGGPSTQEGCTVDPWGGPRCTS